MQSSKDEACWYSLVHNNGDENLELGVDNDLWNTGLYMDCEHAEGALTI